jgi:hypothetical protein
MTEKSTHRQPPEPPTGTQRDAFKRLEARIRAVPRQKLRPMNIRPYEASCLILEAAPKFMALWPQMQKLGGLDLALVENCADLAHAYCYASNHYVMHDPLGLLQEQQREALAIRSKLRLAFELVTLDQNLRGSFVVPLRNTTSYAALAQDLSALARFFRDHQALVGTTLHVKEGDLSRAQELGLLFSEHRAQRGKRDEAVKEATRVAQQTFTLMVAAYKEVRAAVCFLQRNVGNADELAPSLYGGRNSGGRLVAPKVSADSRQT